MKKFLFMAFGLLVFSLANADEFTVSTIISNPSSVFDNLVITGTKEIGFTPNTTVQIGAVDTGSGAIYQQQTVRTSKIMRFATDDDESTAISVVAKDGTLIKGGIFGAQEGIHVYSGGDVFINTGDQDSVSIELYADYLYAYQAVFNTDISVDSIRTIKLEFFGSSGAPIDLGAPYNEIKNGSTYWHKPETTTPSTVDVYTGWHESGDEAIKAGTALENKRPTAAGTRTTILKYSISRVRIEPFCKKETGASNPNEACKPYYEVSSEDSFKDDVNEAAIGGEKPSSSLCNKGSKTYEQFAKENCPGNTTYECILEQDGELSDFTCENSHRTDSGLFCIYNKLAPVTYTIFKCIDGNVDSYSSTTYYRDKLTSHDVQAETRDLSVLNYRFLTFQLDQN